MPCPFCNLADEVVVGEKVGHCNSVVCSNRIGVAMEHRDKHVTTAYSCACQCGPCHASHVDVSTHDIEDVPRSVEVAPPPGAQDVAFAARARAMFVDIIREAMTKPDGGV